MTFLSQIVGRRAISILFGVVSCLWQKSRKLRKITLAYVSARSLKIIEFVTNRQGICDILSVVNSNFDRISHGFGATGDFIGQEITSGTLSLSHLAPSLQEWFHENMLMNIIFLITRINGLKTMKKSLCYVYSFWHNTGVWRTDRQTDRRSDMLYLIQRSTLLGACTNA